MAERHGRLLGRLAELSLSAAEVLHGRLLAAETNAEARDLGLALQRVSRSLRQTLLLEAKLARDLRAEARADAAQAAAAETREVEARKAAVRHAVGRVAAEAGESAEDVEDLLADLDTHLDGYVRAHDFAAEPTDRLVRAICRDLGFTFDDDDENAAPESDGAGPPADAAAAPAPAPKPEPPRLVRMPDGGWAPEPDSS